jgi:phage terminase small subunit
MSGVPGASGGQNRKPTSLKLLQGTWRADRHNPREPVLPAGRPRCPKWLRKQARPFWGRLVGDTERLGVLTEVDGLALALLAEALADYNAAPVEDWRQRSTWAKNALRLLQEFGLTPVSRGRVHVAAPAREPDEFEQLRRPKPQGWEGLLP